MAKSTLPNIISAQQLVDHLKKDGDFKSFPEGTVVHGVVHLGDLKVIHAVNFRSLVFENSFYCDHTVFEKGLYFDDANMNGFCFGASTCRGTVAFVRMKSRGPVHCNSARFMGDFCLNKAELVEMHCDEAVFWGRFFCDNPQIRNDAFFCIGAKFEGKILAYNNHALGMVLYYYKTGNVEFSMSVFAHLQPPLPPLS